LSRKRPQTAPGLRQAADHNALASDMTSDRTDETATDGRTARRDRNRLLVLDAVLELFAEGDLTPSPEAVARRSGVSLRSVYRYVADREDLVHAAIERHLEKIGPLYAFESAGEGPFEARVQQFVTARLRLYQAIAPTSRAAVVRSRFRGNPASEIITERLNSRRGLLRIQLARQFGAELAGFGQNADAIMAAADALTQIETIDWYVVDGGYTLEQTRQSLVAGLRRLLGPGVAGP
jgi:AcrR family transcriptional regulator